MWQNHCVYHARIRRHGEKAGRNVTTHTGSIELFFLHNLRKQLIPVLLPHFVTAVVDAVSLAAYVATSSRSSYYMTGSGIVSGWLMTHHVPATNTLTLTYNLVLLVIPETSSSWLVPTMRETGTILLQHWGTIQWLYVAGGLDPFYDVSAARSRAFCIFFFSICF